MAIISVIVPIYNVDKYLTICLDSILNQTFSDFELVLVDDGSTDESPLICEEYKKKDDRIIVIHKNNGGLSSARNVGLDYIFKNSKSEYISFIDSDDYVDKHFLETMYKSIHGCDLCVCSYETFDDNKQEDKKKITFLKKANLNNYEYWQINNNSGIKVVAWNKLYKKNLFLDIRYPIGKICEDEFVIHYILDKCNHIKILPNTLYHYRLRQNSIMGQINQDDRQFIILDFLVDRACFFVNRDLCCWYEKAFKQLVRMYKIDIKKARPFYKRLKCVFRARQKTENRVPKSEKLFFLSPNLFYCLMNFVYKK